MAASSKGRRKVNFKGKQYFWYVKETEVQVPDTGFVTHERERLVHIFSKDKQFIIRYRLPERGDADTILYVDGKQFPRQPAARSVRVPRWRHDTKRYPTNDFIRRLIGWCLEQPASGGEV